MGRKSFRRLCAVLLALVVAALVGGGVAGAAPYGTNSPRLSVSNPAACLGSSSVTVSGDGFSAGERVDVTRDGTAVTSLAAGSSGSFSQRINIAQLAAGSHTVSATGSKGGAAASAAFTVSSASCPGSVVFTGPTTPAPVTPVVPSGSLAFTGAAVVGLGAVAVFALVGGLVLIVLGRRRA